MSEIRLLLVEDDPDDYLLTRDLLEQMAHPRVAITWTSTCQEGLAALAPGAFDVILLDYRLGAENGLDFLGRMPLEVRTPVILLTGQNDRETDLLAMKAGAVDYLVKAEITLSMLERSIRYAIERSQAQEVQRRAENFRMGQTRIMEMVARAEPIGSILTELALLVEELGDVRCAVVVIEPDDGSGRVAAAPNLPAELWPVAEKASVPPKGGTAVTKASSGGALLAELQTDPAWSAYREAAAKEEVSVVLIQPILSGGGAWIGAICTYLDADVQPTHEEQTAVQNLAQTAAIAIERARSEQSLRESEERFRQLAENIRGAFWMTSADYSEKLYASPGYQEVYGLSPAEVYRRPHAFADLLADEDRDRVLNAFPVGLSEPTTVEYRIVRPDGEKRWVADRAFPVRDAN